MAEPEFDPETMSGFEQLEYNEEFPESDLADYLAYVAEHGTADGYVRPPEEHDTSLTSTPGRACLVHWYCRLHGGTGPGCEKHCMFTRDRAEPRPNCFGFNSGKGILQEGDFLFTTMQLRCLDCRHFLDCADETEKRWQCGSDGDAGDG